MAGPSEMRAKFQKKKFFQLSKSAFFRNFKKKMSMNGNIFLALREGEGGSGSVRHTSLFDFATTRCSFFKIEERAVTPI